MNQRNARLGLMLILGTFIMYVAPASAIDEDTPLNAIRLTAAGGVAPDSWGLVASAEYERYLGHGLGIALRPGFLTYGYDDGDYNEDGNGFGADVGARYYFSREGMNKFYLGVAVGFWGTSWDWEEEGGKGSGNSAAIHLGAEVGYRLPLSERISLTPALYVGDYLSVSSDDDSEFGFYAGVGLSLGYDF